MPSSRWHVVGSQQIDRGVRCHAANAQLPQGKAPLLNGDRSGELDAIKRLVVRVGRDHVHIAEDTVGDLGLYPGHKIVVVECARHRVGIEYGKGDDRRRPRPRRSHR